MEKISSVIDGSKDVEEKLLIECLPPDYPLDLTSRLEEELACRPSEMVVYLEDDSTGVQKSHDVYLITDYSTMSIRSGINAAREAGHRLLFILTNSRALSSRKAKVLNREIAEKLAVIGREDGLTFRIGSRSDSTLRGHFPLEPVALMDTLEPTVGGYDGVIVSHAFLTEMSRITVNRIHFLRVKKSDGFFWFRPVHKTDFAKDKRFGYPTSDMAEYVEYKFANSGLGEINAEDVLHIGISTIRKKGPEGVERKLLSAENRRVITVDIANHRDLQVFVLGLLKAERAGKNFIYRSAASLPSVRVNMRDRPVLTRRDILGARKLSGNLLCLWGSIVELSNTQLEAVLSQVSNVDAISFDVERVLKSDMDRKDVIVSSVKCVEEALGKRSHAVVYTSPRSEYPPGRLSSEARAANQQSIASALQEVYSRTSVKPDVILFKGGVTSSTGLFGCGAMRVYVMGQIAPGIPLVKMLPQDNIKQPGRDMLMVLGPGNVGTSHTYVELIEKLMGTNSEV